ncbi:MAG TPA: PhzF family phenazine biosynthesis isomerase [Actinocatenispora sp.]
MARPVRHMRVVVTAADHEAAVALFRDVLGLPEEAAYEGAGDARVVILDAGRATLELANPAQRDLIDRVEVGRPDSPHIRLAFEVDDAAAATDELTAAGARLVAPPTRTPWESLNARLATAGDLSVTLFQELAPAPGGVPFAMVDVFGEEPLTGNPLAVVDLTDAPRPVDDAWLAAVAREFHQAETTFVLPGSAGVDRVLRSFTRGGVEVYGAGHNALGAWWWLLDSGRVTAAPGSSLVQRIGGRDLTVGVREGGWLALRQEPARFGATGDPAAVAGPLGLSPGDLLAAPPPQVVDTGAGHLMVLAGTRAAVSAATPDTARLVELTAALGAEGVYLVWLDPTGRAHARFFNPGMGLAEDAATGTAAGPLAAYLRRAGLLAANTELVVRQGEDMGRPSTLRVGLSDDDTPTLSGRGVTTMTGTLRTP